MTHGFSLAVKCGVLTVACAILAGCTATYVAAWKQLGWESRDLLVDQVGDTRSRQEAAKEQFTSALDQFKATYSFDGGDLEEAYNKLQKDYDRCVAQADDFRDEIGGVKRLGKAFFNEWESDIADQPDPSSKKMMVQQRDQTQEMFDTMVAKMDEAADKMDPVLEAFRGRVLLLKSSLNAQALASLESNADELVDGIEALIVEMNQSIAEADEFIAAMSAG
ncbi:MAG: DUF2959 family protein [Planctomycetota bacterium]